MEWNVFTEPSAIFLLPSSEDLIPRDTSCDILHQFGMKPYFKLTFSESVYLFIPAALPSWSVWSKESEMVPDLICYRATSVQVRRA